MHKSPAVKLGCTDCHGGNAAAAKPDGSEQGDPGYNNVKDEAHVAPRFPEAWPTSANPERTYTLLTKESPEFVRFINPGDLRVAQEACGECHQQQVDQVHRSNMTTASIFWTAASYANGILPFKKAIIGESYDREGNPQGIPQSVLTARQETRGALDNPIVPLPRWQVVPPGEYFRAFERGSLFNLAIFPEIGNPNPLDEPGLPDIRVSERGPGTGQRISPAVINLHKTRLNDPHLSFLGTNDHPGDYRSSGCSACHVMYANDRDTFNSGPWAQYGHLGKSASKDPTIPKDESGHPIKHQMTRAIATSQCMSCHMHQPNSFVNTYVGYTMWDYETDAELFWPKEQRYPTLAEKRESLDHNPEGAAIRGLWTDKEFLANVRDLNDDAEHTQFADYHGHGWVFRAVFSRDKKGNLLDENGQIVSFDDPEKFEKAVHLKDIHLERGMHCVDCHFSQDAHGVGYLVSEYADAIEIECQDCHGDVDRKTDLLTSGPAAPAGGTDLSIPTTPFGRPRFEWVGDELKQRSMLTDGLEWTVKQVLDTVTPGHGDYNEASAYAKTIRRDGETWGPLTANDTDLPHGSGNFTCYACHSSWITACFGCHLPQEANQKSEVYRYEGETLRNYASYNPQVVRTDAYMLGRNSLVKGQKIAPVRSSSALVLSSINPNRQRIYIQQPPISTPGFSSQAFNPHVPHTVRTKETKGCEDCHISEQNDNNAWMAQLLTLGTNWVNFIGRYAWVGLGEGGIEAVAVTEWEEPQAVIGSSLHKVAYPDFYAEHQAHEKELQVAHHHHGEVVSLQLRGEYLYTAGEKGFRVYDVANIDNKDFSERFVTAPFSPIGQDTYVKTKHATGVALPTNMPMGPDREQVTEYAEQAIHPIYRYAVVSDSEEGLILVDVSTLTNGDPRDNFLERALTWDGDGALHGAQSVTLAGHIAYVGTPDGLVVVDLDDPLQPKLGPMLSEVRGARSIAVQFRYAFVIDNEGLAVVDVTDLKQPRLVTRLAIAEAKNVYVARTYAYVAAGSQGMVIVDVTRPEKPEIDQTFNADGKLNDTHDIKIGSTNSSLFAYVADGHNGLAVVQLTSPKTVPGYLGFSPRPVPKLIAHAHTEKPAVAISKGLDRDRAVDETGHQVSIFNRVGARPLTLEEMQRLYLRDGEVFRVSDETPGPPLIPEGNDAEGEAP